MKYRIKIITYRSGRKEYLCQVRCSFLFLKWFSNIDFKGETCSYKSPVETRDRALQRIDKHYNGNTIVHSIDFEYINK